MKKIVHFSQDFRLGKPQLGGYSRILNEIEDGNTHFIFTVGFTDDFFSIKINDSLNLPVYQIGVGTINYFSLIKQPVLIFRIVFKIHKILKEKNVVPDVLFGHAQLFNFYVLWILKKLYFKQVKLIWEFNVIWGCDSINGIKRYFRSLIQNWSQFFVVKKADGFIFQTKFCKDFIFRKYKIKSKNNEIILNAVNYSNRSIENERISDAILIYGLLDDLNGIPFVIDFIRMYHENLKFEFHFYGNGVYAKSLELMALEYSKVKYFGSVPKNEIPSLLTKYKFGLIPRIKTLGSDLYIPTKVVEMLNFCVVVIASDVFGLIEVIKHNSNGLIFKAEEKQDLFILLEKLPYFSELDFQKLQKHGRETIQNDFNLNTQLLKQKHFINSLFS
jgi:glycosyltransferase involved in cell wall biosynthesis